MLSPEQTRRSTLGSLATSALLAPFAGCLSALHPANNSESTAEPPNWIAETDVSIYLEGLGVDLDSPAETVEQADLAVFGGGLVPSHDVAIEGVTGGTSLAVVGDHPNRTLVGSIQNVPPADVPEKPKKSSAMVGNLGYSFGYELPSTPTEGIALAYPASDDVLELHTHVAEYENDRLALNAALGQHHTVTRQTRTATMESPGDRDDWQRRGRVSTTTRQCPGGLGERTVDCYTLPGEEGLVFWRFQDSMTPGPSPGSGCAGDLTNHNEQLMRQMRHGGSHGGEILNFNPTTSGPRDTVSIQLGWVEDPWQYDVRDVTVLATLNPADEWVRWEHDVEHDSPAAAAPFIAEPGLIVRYPPETSVATNDWMVSFDFRNSGGNDSHVIEAIGTGAWLID